MPKKCIGIDGVPCAFGLNQKAAQVNGEHNRCLWCSEDRMMTACRDSKVGRNNLLQGFKKMTQEQQSWALRRVPPFYQATFRELTARSFRCQGLRGEACIFQESNQGGAAQAKAGSNQCLWCSPELLEAACRSVSKRKQLLPRLRRLALAARNKAVEERIPEEHKEFFRDALAGAPLTGKGRGRNASQKRPAANALVSWADVLKKRQSLRAEPSKEQKEAYRKQVLADRARVRHNFGLPKAGTKRGQEVSNDTGLPHPKRTKLGMALWNWACANSWKMCNGCSQMVPMRLTQSALAAPSVTPTVSASQCSRCQAKVQCAAPIPEEVPEELQGLSAESIAALAHLEIDVGPELRAKNLAKQPSGYRQHATIARFFWHSKTAKQRIQEIKDKVQRKKAKAAREYLRKATGCSYGAFEDLHKKFLAKHPDADERQRRRRLQFIEATGLETAV